MKALIAKSNELGMQTFDQHLFHLIEAGLITMEDGLRNADSVNDLRLRLKLDSKSSQDSDLLEGTAGLMVEETEKDAGLINKVKRASLG
jgi:twitching motility protein PilU